MDGFCLLVSGGRRLGKRLFYKIHWVHGYFQDRYSISELARNPDSIKQAIHQSKWTTDIYSRTIPSKNPQQFSAHLPWSTHRALLSHRFHSPSEDKQELLNQDYFLIWGSKRGELNLMRWGWETGRDQPRVPSGPLGQNFSTSSPQGLLLQSKDYHLWCTSRAFIDSQKVTKSHHP